MAVGRRARRRRYRPRRRSPALVSGTARRPTPSGRPGHRSRAGRRRGSRSGRRRYTQVTNEDGTVDRRVDQRDRRAAGATGRPTTVPDVFDGVPAVTETARGTVGLLGAGVMGEAILAAVLRGGTPVGARPGRASRRRARGRGRRRRTAYAPTCRRPRSRPERHRDRRAQAQGRPGCPRDDRRRTLRPGALVVSVAAGVTTARWRSSSPPVTRWCA